MTKVLRDQDVTVVELDAEYDSFDMLRLQQVHDLLVALAQTVTPPRLVLDLRQTRFLGSAFLEMVFRAWKRLQERQGAFALCCLQPYCAEVIKATRLDHLWPSYATREEAVRALAENAASP
jgi:anti-anti-sigma factor